VLLREMSANSRADGRIPSPTEREWLALVLYPDRAQTEALASTAPRESAITSVGLGQR
jgi:hypothetical protein